MNNNNDEDTIADGIVRVLLYNGCSGSSATFKLSQQILDAHGFKSWKGKSELDKPKNNPFYYEARKKVYDSGAWRPTSDDFVIEALKLLNNHVQHIKKKILFTKQFYDRAHLFSIDSAYAAMYRRNKLDVAICFVKDCFKVNKKTGMSTLGYSLFANNNTKTDKGVCFTRRNNDNLVLKVHLETDKLIEFLVERVDEEEERIQKFKALISPAKEQYYEDLFAFTYSSNYGIFKKSIQAWCTLLRAITAYIDEDVVKDVLLPIKNTRKPPPSHKEIIENFEEVKNALKKAKLARFLRK